jgi:hypothetical protein
MPPTRPPSLLDRLDVKDAATGIGLILVAAWFATTALRRLALGTPSNMGPGFFPLMVAAGLAAMGLLLIVGAFRRPTEPTEFTSLRGTICILAAPLVFAFGVAPLGFVPAIAATTFVASWGSRLMTLRFTLALTVALTGLSTLLFVKLLRMPVALFGPWLGY